MPSPHNDDKTVVAIVGGGCAGMAAAWQLAKLPGYEIHVYERGVRLGGKGASTRADDGRILEHGLHVWMGFYDNAFRMMRECYDEVRKHGWGPDHPSCRLPHGSLDDAFMPEPHIGAAGTDRRGEWEMWSGHFAPTEGRPGDPLDADTNPFTLASYLTRCVALLKTLMVSTAGPARDGQPGRPRPDGRSTIDEEVELDFGFSALLSPRVLIERMVQATRDGVLITAAGLLQIVTIFETWLRGQNFAPQVADTALEFFEAIASQVRKQLRDFVEIDEHLRRKTEIIDIVITIVVGLYRDKVLFGKEGLDALNGMDYRDWLRKHGATHTAVESRFITGIYDLLFAYRRGDRKRPALAAGVALRGALRMFFTYRGSLFWRMRSGMGEAVFAPLYRTLSAPPGADAPGAGRASPVSFHFGHALDKAEFSFPSKHERRVSALVFRTVALDDGEPALDDFGCWSKTADPWAGGRGTGEKRLTHRMTRDGPPAGEQFDAVIFAIGIADFKTVFERSGAACEDGGEISTAFFSHMPPEWKWMCDKVETVATQSAQVWLPKSLSELGWQRGSGIFTALPPPFDTWADMTAMLPSEHKWRETMKRPAGDARAAAARSLSYFCGALPEAVVDEARRKLHSRGRSAPGTSRPGALEAALKPGVEADLGALLAAGMRPFWPDAARGAVATASRHVRVNATGSDRYTLSLPKSIRYRISPLARPVLNMTIAGDWTACGLDAGCIEAAVMSGMLAAHAITGGTPSLDSITGYHHP